MIKYIAYVDTPIDQHNPDAEYYEFESPLDLSKHSAVELYGPNGPQLFTITQILATPNHSVIDAVLNLRRVNG